MRNSFRLLLLTAVMVLQWAIPVAAAPNAGFAEGVKAYNQRQYRQALAFFQQASAAAPTDPLIHYYLGLSYQGLNQMSLAKQEYAYVSRCNNKILQIEANAALANLSKYRTTYSGAAPVVKAAEPTARNEGPKLDGRLQVLYFSSEH